MIIDFRIETQHGGYKKPDILAGFNGGNGEYAYKGLMKVATSASEHDKLCLVKQSLRDWELLRKIDLAHADISALISGSGEKIHFTNDLGLYVSDIKFTIDVLLGAK